MQTSSIMDAKTNFVSLPASMSDNALWTNGRNSLGGHIAFLPVTVANAFDACQLVKLVTARSSTPSRADSRFVNDDSCFVKPMINSKKKCFSLALRHTLVVLEMH